MASEALRMVCKALREASEAWRKASETITRGFRLRGRSLRPRERLLCPAERRLCPAERLLWASGRLLRLQRGFSWTCTEARCAAPGGRQAPGGSQKVSGPCPTSTPKIAIPRCGRTSVNCLRHSHSAATPGPIGQHPTGEAPGGARGRKS